MNKFRINLTEGAGYNGPYINKFSSGFDAIEFYVDKSFPKDCTYAVIYSVCGDVGMSTDSDSNVAVSADPDTGKTLVTWTLGREVTCDSGVVIYQVVVYSADEEGNGAALWYSPQGRIVVGDSIDTTEYETASIAAEPSLVSQLITKTNKLSRDSDDHLRRIDILEQLQQATERRVDEIYGELSRDMASAKTKLTELNNGVGEVKDGLSDAVENISENADRLDSLSENLDNTDKAMSDHNENKVIHMSAQERARAEDFFSVYDANGLLSLTASEAEETNALLGRVVSIPCNLRIAFMTGAHSLDCAPYNKLKLLSSYGICDYVVNGGGFAPQGKSLSVADALEISKAAGTGTLTVRGDNSPEDDVWGNVFCGGEMPYYYIDDHKKNVRIVVLDTANMDNLQLHWFVKDALRPELARPVIILSHRNLSDFVLQSDGSSLFAKIFKLAQECGSLTLSDGVMCDDIVEFRAEVSTKFDATVEIIATVHGNCGIDICKNDLSDNFCNLGVAEDFADGKERSAFEECEVDIHSDVSKAADANSIVRANVTDMDLNGVSAMKFQPVTDEPEAYIVMDVFDISATEGYIVIDTAIRLGANVPDTGLFYIATNQSRAISKSLSIGDLSAKADDNGWVRFTVVICKKTGDANYGLYNTYINGVSHTGWHSGYLGEITANGTVRSDIRLVAKELTKDSVLYFGRSRVYVSPAMPSEGVLKNGISDSLFCYGGELYNSEYEQELLSTLEIDKGCYDVLCIDTTSQKIECCRFGYGFDRNAGWVVPDIVFE